jgi:predicted ArsR family transcriptional regulator
MSYLSKDDPRVLLAQYKNGDDSESDVLEDLVDWIENEWDDSTANVDNDKEKVEIEELIRRVVSIINQYGWLKQNSNN